jgi:hypothetical protein
MGIHPATRCRIMPISPLYVMGTRRAVTPRMEAFRRDLGNLTDRIGHLSSRDAGVVGGGESWQFAVDKSHYSAQSALMYRRLSGGGTSLEEEISRAWCETVDISRRDSLDFAGRFNCRVGSDLRRLRLANRPGACWRRAGPCPAGVLARLINVLVKPTRSPRVAADK